MKFLFLPFYILLSANLFASEVVTCSKDYKGTDIHTAYQLKNLTIKYEADMPGSSEGSLKAKGQIGYAGIRSEVKRTYTEKSLIYKSLSSNDLSLKLTKFNDAFKGVLTLNSDSSFKNVIKDLNCTIKGELPKPKTCEESQANKDVALFNALRTSDLDEIKFSLECGADVNSLDKLGCSPLLKVLDLQCGQNSRISTTIPTYNQTEIATLLIDSGANLESVDPSNNQTAIHKVALSGDSDLALMLIGLEVNLDSQDNNLETPLMFAVQSNNFFLVRDLVNANANLELKNKFGKTAQNIASDLNRTAIGELLIPIKRSILIEGNSNNTGCSVSNIELSLNEPVEIVLKASKNKMFLFESAMLELELMAMPNEVIKTRFTPSRAGVYKFMCGPHGGPMDQQTIGTISVQ